MHEYKLHRETDQSQSESIREGIGLAPASTATALARDFRDGSVASGLTIGRSIFDVRLYDLHG
jgi:hypothetical protein